MVHRSVLNKIIAQRARPHFFTVVVILVRLDALQSSIFSVKNLGYYKLSKTSKYEVMIYWMENQRLLLPTVCVFIIQGPP